MKIESDVDELKKAFCSCKLFSDGECDLKIMIDVYDLIGRGVR